MNRPADEPLWDTLRQVASRRPAALALSDLSLSLPWSAFLDAATRGALHLQKNGLRRGDRVLLRCDHSAHFAIAYFAVHAAGGVCVIAASDTPALLAQAAARTGALFTLTPSDVASLCGSGPTRGVLPALLPDHLADILYTTGTTGEPKGVVLTHGNVANAALNIGTLLSQDESDIELCSLPLTHSFGLGRLRVMARTGSTLIIQPSLSAIGHILEVARQHRVTALPLSPAGLALLRRLRAEREVSALRSTLRFIELLGAPILPPLRKWAQEHFCDVRLGHHYGLTEASRAAGVDLFSPHAELGCIGSPAPHVTIEVRDGELWLRGPVVAKEYWQDPELTSATFVDGAVRTRDLGRIDDAGRIFLLGRLSDLINVGGIKVAPQEVEALIAKHPAISEVACCGVPDPAGISGERVAAFVVSSQPLTLGELNAWLRQYNLDHPRMPVGLTHVAALPRTPSGKLLRRDLLNTPPRDLAAGFGREPDRAK